MTHLPLHLRAGGVSVVLAGDEGQVPHIAHWGRDLGDLTDEDLRALVLVGRAQLMPNTCNTSWRIPFRSKLSGIVTPVSCSSPKSQPIKPSSRCSRARAWPACGA